MFLSTSSIPVSKSGAKGKSAGDEGAEDSKGFVGASSKVNEENPAEPAEISMLGDSPGCKSMAMRNVKSGKFIIIVTDRSEASWTQPVPGHKGSHFYVAKVLRRDGGLIKIQYYATEGANRRWFEGRGVDNKHYLEERDVDPGEIVAVFDGLTKKDKKLPVAVGA